SNALKLLYGNPMSSASVTERGLERICLRWRKSRCHPCSPACVQRSLKHRYSTPFLIGLVSVAPIELVVGRPHPARSRVDTGEGRHWLKRRLQVANLVQPILHIGGVRGRTR